MFRWKKASIIGLMILIGCNFIPAYILRSLAAPKAYPNHVKLLKQYGWNTKELEVVGPRLVPKHKGRIPEQMFSSSEAIGLLLRKSIDQPATVYTYRLKKRPGYRDSRDRPSEYALYAEIWEIEQKIIGAYIFTQPLSGERFIWPGIFPLNEEPDHTSLSPYPTMAMQGSNIEV